VQRKKNAVVPRKSVDECKKSISCGSTEQFVRAAEKIESNTISPIFFLPSYFVEQNGLLCTPTLFVSFGEINFDQFLLLDTQKAFGLVGPTLGAAPWEVSELQRDQHRNNHFQI
jgi:hypothetical protein